MNKIKDRLRGLGDQILVTTVAIVIAVAALAQLGASGSAASTVKIVNSAGRVIDQFGYQNLDNLPFVANVNGFYGGFLSVAAGATSIGQFSHMVGTIPGIMPQQTGGCSIYASDVSFSSVDNSISTAGAFNWLTNCAAATPGSFIDISAPTGSPQSDYGDFQIAAVTSTKATICSAVGVPNANCTCPGGSVNCPTLTTQTAGINTSINTIGNSLLTANEIVRINALSYCTGDSSNTAKLFVQHAQLKISDPKRFQLMQVFDLTPQGSGSTLPAVGADLLFAALQCRSAMPLPYVIYTDSDWGGYGGSPVGSLGGGLINTAIGIETNDTYENIDSGAAHSVTQTIYVNADIFQGSRTQ